MNQTSLAEYVLPWIYGLLGFSCLALVLHCVGLWRDRRVSLVEFILGVVFVLAYSTQALMRLGSAIGWVMLSVQVLVAGGILWVNFTSEIVMARAALRREVRGVKKLLEKEPKDPALRCSLGDAYRRLGRLTEALEEYKAAQTLEPGEREYRHKAELTERIIESHLAMICACPRCATAVYGSMARCPSCGEILDEYRYAAFILGRDQYVMVALITFVALLVVFTAGQLVGWCPAWLIVALSVVGFTCLMLILMRRTRKVADSAQSQT